MENKKSSVYFLKHKNLSPIKIGHSKDSNPIRRVNSYLTYAPYGIDYIGFIQIKGKENSILIEKKIHSFFKNRKIHREWFDITINELYEYLLKNGYQLIQKKHTIKKTKSEQIFDFYIKNKNVKKTALEFNVSIQYVYKVLKANK